MSTEGEAAPATETKFVVVHNKKNVEVSVNLETGTVKDLKEAIEKETGVPLHFQKIMVKGMMLKDDAKPLKDVKTLKKGVKLLLVGSSVNEVKEVNDSTKAAKAAKDMARENEGLKAQSKATVSLPVDFQKELPHKTIIAAGPPEKALPGKANVQSPLPRTPLAGVVDSNGDALRLSFKVIEQKLVINSASRTDELPFYAISGVLSAPIEGREEYSIIALKLGPTEKSLRYIYWVPSQYVNAIKMLFI